MARMPGLWLHDAPRAASGRSTAAAPWCKQRKMERMPQMNRALDRQPPSEMFSRTSFLDIANPAYIESLQWRYLEDPNSVGPEWRDFFSSLGDDAVDIRRTAAGASWKSANWPTSLDGDLISALDGNWAKELEVKARQWSPSDGDSPLREPRYGAGIGDHPGQSDARTSGLEAGSTGFDDTRRKRGIAAFLLWVSARPILTALYL